MATFFERDLSTNYLQKRPLQFYLYSKAVVVIYA